MNDYATHGDWWTRRAAPMKVEQHYVDEVKRELCLKTFHTAHGTASFWFHQRSVQVRAFEFLYGDFWFVRVPWKGLRHAGWWYAAAQHNSTSVTFQHQWDTLQKLLKIVDKDGDGTISGIELDDKVLADGIDPQRYVEQIGAHQRCRAAALMTFLLQYNVEPYRITWNEPSEGIEHEIFRFSECNNSNKRSPIA